MTDALVTAGRCEECGKDCGAGQQVHAHIKRFCSPSCKNKAWRRQHRPGKAIAVPVRAEHGPVAFVAPAPAGEVVAELLVRVAKLEARPLGRAGSIEPATGWKHGANCYRNHGCRCEVCVSGMRARKR